VTQHMSLNKKVHHLQLVLLFNCVLIKDPTTLIGTTVF